MSPRTKLARVRLSRETLRSLGDAQLRRVGGGNSEHCIDPYTEQEGCGPPKPRSYNCL